MEKNNKIVAIIQARTTSARLPNKVLKKINNKTIVELVYLRLKKSKLINNIIFAIPDSKSNFKLKEHLLNKNIPFFEGSEKNVLKRYYDASNFTKANTIVRITADCPLIDANIVDNVIKLHFKKKSLFTTNINPPSFPDGLDVQVSSKKVLNYVYKNAKTKYQKEHVFTLLETDKNIKIYNYPSKIDYSKIRITLDQKEDFKLIKYIYNYFKPNIYIKFEDVIKLMKKERNIFKINQKYQRNSGSQEINSDKLWNKAKNIIPGGNSLLSKNPELFSNTGWPNYFMKAKENFVWDLNKKKYLDMIMSPGTNILGYANKEINKKISSIINHSNMSTLNPAEEVQLANELLSIHKWAGMARFAKTGGEANTIAVRIARAASKDRYKIAFCGYHGWHDWYLSANLNDNDVLGSHLLSGLDTKGVPTSLKNSVFGFQYNDISSLKKIINQHKDIGIVKMEVTRNYQPKNNFLKQVKEVCKKNNLILIFDECTTGFRLNLGGIHKKYNVNPDIAVFGKALSNGYPLTAIIGKKNIMKFAQYSFISSTYWTDRLGFVAALETLKYMKKYKTWEKIKINGLNIKKNWLKLAKKHSLDIIVEGSDAIPSFRFKKDIHNLYKSFITQEMLKYNILATNYIFVSIYHTNINLKNYYKILDKILEKLKLHESNKFYLDKKKYTLKKQFFKRLN